MFKRFFDVIVSLMLLLILAPLFIMVGILIRIQLGSPVFFRQERPGFAGKPFKMIKFRTMLAEQESLDAAPDAVRLTSLGTRLRALSIDELPELWNVLKDDMSLVGPRPLLMEYLPLYNDEQRRRHEVKPGITGWAQVNGRNAISWEEKFKLDVWYVKHQNVWLDFKILLLTVFKVCTRQGINAAGHVTANKFSGDV